VILGDPPDRPVVNGIGTRATLDELFRWAAIRRPNALALLDPPNRTHFADGQPRHLTYAQADRMISAIAGRLHRMGLRRDAIVGLQFGNTVESVLVLLAVLRAGLIAMPLPLLWRRAEAVAALNRVGANALMVSGRVGAVDHFALAMEIAAETFPVRFVCGFGRKPPDGVIGLDDLYDAETLDPLPTPEAKRANLPGPGAHLAVITWDVSPDGPVPVARSHAELVAGGLAVLLEGHIARDAVILSTLTMASFAGLASALVPWLMAGGTLALHHPFDGDTFAAQRNAMICDTIILPGPLAVPLAEAGHLVARNGLKRVVGIWRAPERLPRAPVWLKAELAMIDVQVFGETGLIAAMRDPSGQVAEIPFGLLPAPRGTKGAVIVGEVQRSVSGTVELRGPMLPHGAFPAGVERTQFPHVKITPQGMIDTGYTCPGPKVSHAMVVSGPPAGIVGVGGYRFVTRKLQTLVGPVDDGSTLAALPDALAGHRLAGSAADRARVREMLAKKGVNPLLVGAFAALPAVEIDIVDEPLTAIA